MEAITGNPEVMMSLVEIALSILGLVLTLVIPPVALKAYKLFGVKIEEKHMKSLHEATMTWAENLMRYGSDHANDELAEDLMKYWEESVPDAVSALKPTITVAMKLAGRYFGWNGATPSPAPRP